MRVNINPYYVSEKEKQGELYNNEIQRVKELSANIKRGEDGEMKERFTTLQVLRMLTMQEDMTFVSVTEGRRYKAAAVWQTVVMLTECAEGEYCPATIIPMDIMWVEQDKPKVKKEVSFITAIQAHHDGEEIYSLVDGHKSCYKPLIGSGEQMIDSDGMPLTTMEILEGIWYINE